MWSNHDDNFYYMMLTMIILLGRVLTKYGFVFKCLDVDEAILVKDMKKDSENNECEKLLKRLIYRNQSIIKERH